MSTGYQSSKAKGSKAECRTGKVRHMVTLDQVTFAVIRDSAMGNSRSVSEEMAVRLAASVDLEAIKS
jgi:hypothetical protein